MASVDVVNQENKKVGTIDLRDDIFAVDVNVPLVHQVIKAQLADRRQGTAKTKVKSEVRGGGRKPFKQKGTGNARQGSTRSPLQVGGGQSFGPIPRSYAQRTPKEMMRGALRSALSDRLKAKRLIIVDEFKLTAIKTKVLHDIVTKKFQLDMALVVDNNNRNLELSSRNIPRLKVLRSEGLNVYDIIRHEWVVLTKAAVAAVEIRLGAKSEKPAKTAPAKAAAAPKKAKAASAKAE